MGLRSRAATPAVAVAGTRQYLVATCSGVYFAIPAEIVRSILQLGEGVAETARSAFGLKASPSHLAERFGLTGSYLSPEARIVVCGVRLAYQAYFIDALEGLYDVQASQLKPLPSAFTGPERRWFTGLFLFREGVSLVVNSEWLLDSDNNQSACHSASGIEPVGSSAAQKLSSHVASSAVATSEDIVDLLNLEEATDAEDTPWAQI